MELNKYVEIEVAHKEQDLYRWVNELPDTYRSQYYNKIHLERYFEKNSILYVRLVNRKYLLALVDAGLKIAGDVYVLALSLCGGRRDTNEFHQWYRNLKNRTYKKDEVALKHMLALEKYINLYGLCCGVWDDGKVRWIPHAEHHIKIKSLKSYFSNHPKSFIMLDKRFFYLPPRKEVVENLFFKCAHLAGGEYALAMVTSKSEPNTEEREKLFRRHLNAFRRLSFSHRETISYYISLFEKYLSTVPQLFDAEVDVA